MRAQRDNDSSTTGSNPALRNVRRAFSRFDREDTSKRPESEPGLDQLPSLRELVADLLAIDEFHVSGAARRELDLQLAAALRKSAAVTNAAFDWELPDSLDDAHRSLYSLYADRVWRAPSEPRPEYAEIAIRRIRSSLETGFRHYLARRRGFEPLTMDGAADASEWVQALALGSHPRDHECWGEFARDRVELDQLKEVVAQRSLFFLREPDPWIYAIPTLEGAPKAGLMDLLLDEYGWGKLERMHSNVYATLMGALDLPATTDYFESASSWRYIATLNHQWMCALTPEHSRRLLGTIYLTEATSPDAMTNYLAAWERLGISDPEVTEFYELHVSADENHRDVALHEVVMPVCQTEPAALDEVALGIFDARTLEAEFADYLVERFASGRSSLEAQIPLDAALSAGATANDEPEGALR